MSIGELNCPSLQYVYDMTWAEYLIRLYAYNRIRKKQLRDVREIAWASLVGPHQNPKKLPKTIEAYWPLDGKPQVNDFLRDRIKFAQDEYKERLKKLNNGR